MSTTEPAAPDSLPKYLADGLPKQDGETLEDVQAFVATLLEHKASLADRPINAGDLPEDAEIVEHEPKRTVYLEHRTCGGESCHCISGGEKHGPYKYRAYWFDGSVKREYRGKTGE
ncbi:hypothetical protein [Halalkalicoccus salilacus]|uniref:hypothetical protein n=1 Tax=Halalkalicoccus salilacus TaxID=3117459 RepID=UPI00300F134B